MAVRRRNTEREHAFSAQVARYCQIYDLQGVLMDKDWKPTAAVEAFTADTVLETEQIVGSVLSRDDLYAKCVFAEKAGIPLYLLLHTQGQPGIMVYEFQADHAQKAPAPVSEERLSEQAFVAWWRRKKGTEQTKSYGSDLQSRIRASYFDTVLEGAGESWGGNVDGFLISRETGDMEILGIVENRYTQKTPLREYDPNHFFHYRGGDYNTWLPLFNLCIAMRIPLFLMTYSNRQGETGLTGVTQLKSLDKTGLIYICSEGKTPLYPQTHIMSSLSGIKEWLLFRAGLAGKK